MTDSSPKTRTPTPLFAFNQLNSEIGESTYPSGVGTARMTLLILLLD